MEEPTGMDRTRAELAAVERGISVVQQVIAQEHAAFHPDNYDRVPAEMPNALRALYETGTWSSAPVYCWDLIARVSAEGHEKAREAEDALAHMSFRPPPGLAQVALTSLRAEHSPAVIDAAARNDAVRGAVRSAIEAKREERAKRTQGLAAEYQDLRKSWRARMAQATANRTQKRREESLADDRLLVMATRAVSGMGGGMSVKECDAYLEDIRSSGGTAGGVSRWGVSLATIPDQDPWYAPPDGGILMDDPLAEHYFAKNINPWTRAERLLFLEKFVAHSKNFRRISTFFEHKSVEDVVRFYFENKKPLKLKQIAKDSQVKKRANKKNLLVELSRMPIEGRSIKNNFAGEAAAAIMDGATPINHNTEYFGSSYTASNGPSPWNASEASLMREAGRGWKPPDQQALIFALCRHKIEDDFSSLHVPAVWCQISHEVRTKSPAQCRQFYAHFKSLLSLDKYQPPDLNALRRAAPKRRRVGNGTASSCSDSMVEPPTNRPRMDQRCMENGSSWIHDSARNVIIENHGIGPTFGAQDKASMSAGSPSPYPKSDGQPEQVGGTPVGSRGSESTDESSELADYPAVPARPSAPLGVGSIPFGTPVVDTGTYSAAKSIALAHSSGKSNGFPVEAGQSGSPLGKRESDREYVAGTGSISYPVDRRTAPTQSVGKRRGSPNLVTNVVSSSRNVGDIISTLGVDKIKPDAKKRKASMVADSNAKPTLSSAARSDTAKPSARNALCRQDGSTPLASGQFEKQPVAAESKSSIDANISRSNGKISSPDSEVKENQQQSPCSTDVATGEQKNSKVVASQKETGMKPASDSLKPRGAVPTQSSPSKRAGKESRIVRHQKVGREATVPDEEGKKSDVAVRPPVNKKVIGNSGNVSPLTSRRGSGENPDKNRSAEGNSSDGPIGSVRTKGDSGPTTMSAMGTMKSPNGDVVVLNTVTSSSAAPTAGS